MTDPTDAQYPVTTVERPNPLMAVAMKIGPAWGALSGLIVALVPLGILSAEQADAVSYLGDSVVSSTSVLAPVVGGVIAAFLHVLQSFAQAKVSKSDVTPSADPRDDQGRRLTPDVIVP